MKAFIFVNVSIRPNHSFWTWVRPNSVDKYITIWISCVKWYYKEYKFRSVLVLCERVTQLKVQT